MGLGHGNGVLRRFRWVRLHGPVGLDAGGIPACSRWLSARHHRYRGLDALHPGRDASHARMPTGPRCGSSTEVVWTELAPLQGAGRSWSVGFRWCRCAQPPATGLDPSGIGRSGHGVRSCRGSQGRRRRESGEGQVMEVGSGFRRERVRGLYGAGFQPFEKWGRIPGAMPQAGMEWGRWPRGSTAWRQRRSRTWG